MSEGLISDSGADWAAFGAYALLGAAGGDDSKPVATKPEGLVAEGARATPEFKAGEAVAVKSEPQKLWRRALGAAFGAGAGLVGGILIGAVGLASATHGVSLLTPGITGPLLVAAGVAGMAIGMRQGWQTGFHFDINDFRRPHVASPEQQDLEGKLREKRAMAAEFAPIPVAQPRPATH